MTPNVPFNRDKQIARVASRLVELARERRMAPDQRTSVGEAATQIPPTQEPSSSQISLYWDWRSSLHPQDLVPEIYPLLAEPFRSTTSYPWLLDRVRQLAYSIGTSLLDQRASTDCHAQAETLLSNLVTEIESSHDRREVIVPLINLVLNVPDSRITIGPVEIVTDRLDAYLFQGGDASKLGLFGHWAISHFQVGQKRGNRRVPPDIQSVSAYARVRDILGDREGAIQHARTDIATALSILRMISFRFGSWSDPARYGSDGSFFDPVHRFGLLGMPIGGTTVALTRPSGSDSSDFAFQIDQTGIHMPVVIEGEILTKKKALVEQLVKNMWAKQPNWKEVRLAVEMFNEGLDATTAEDAFLKYVIAMEVLFGKVEKGWAESQTTRLSERIAFLLGEHESEKRWSVFANFKDLYEKRSAIVHRGGVVTDHDVLRMEAITRLAILRLLWEINLFGHPDLNAFIDRVRRLKFGEGLEQTDAPDFLRLSDSWFV